MRTLVDLGVLFYIPVSALIILDARPTRLTLNVLLASEPIPYQNPSEIIGAHRTDM
jgi:hypothetical protein